MTKLFVKYCSRSCSVSMWDFCGLVLFQMSDQAINYLMSVLHPAFALLHDVTPDYEQKCRWKEKNRCIFHELFLNCPPFGAVFNYLTFLRNSYAVNDNSFQNSVIERKFRVQSWSIVVDGVHFIWLVKVLTRKFVMTSTFVEFWPLGVCYTLIGEYL